MWPTSDAAIEDAFNRGDILRTHVLRPTWHFVTSADARWLLAPTAPRVHVTNGAMYRLLELDGETLSRGADAMTRALRGGNQLIRTELKDVLDAARIPTVGGRDRSGQCLAYILISTLHREKMEGQTYWFADPTPPRPKPSPTAYLVSVYDEYAIGYKDQSPIGGAEYAERMTALGNALQNVIIIDGRIAGTWRRNVTKSAVRIELNPFRVLSDGERAAVGQAAERFGEFFGKTSEVSEPSAV